MKKKSDNKYITISSFEDFRREKELLILRSKIIDARMSLDFMQLKSDLSPLNLFSSLAKEYLMPVVAGLLRFFVKKTE